MNWRTTADVTEFLGTAGHFLRRERERNTILLTVAATVAERPDRYGPVGPRFGWWAAGAAGAGPASEPDNVAGAFVHTPPFPVLLSAMPADAAAELAATWPGDRPAGAAGAAGAVNGNPDAAQAFAAAWRERTGAIAEVSRRERLYRLWDLVPPPAPPAGTERVAGTGDRDFLAGWFRAFAADAHEVTEDDYISAVDDKLSYGGLTLWEDGGRPVAMAGLTRTVAGMTRVGPVYTPRHLRGRGYASAVTAAVSAAALAAGAEEVLLFTDLKNPVSNSIYQRLGYRSVEDRVVLTLRGS